MAHVTHPASAPGLPSTRARTRARARAHARARTSALARACFRPLPLLALALALPLAALASGCGLLDSRNDPDTRGAVLVRVDLSLADAGAFERGSGRLFLRLMPGSGDAHERELPWTFSTSAPALPPGAAPGSGDAERTEPEARREGAPARAVAFLHDRGGLPPALALFDDLPGGAYRLSSFLVSLRVERREGPPLLASLSGELTSLAPVRVAPGELADAGVLAITLAPGGRYEYRALHDAGDRAGSVLAARPDLARFRTVARPVAARERAAPVAEGEARARPGPASGRVRPRNVAGEPRRPESEPAALPAEGGAPTPEEIAAALAAGKSAAVLGISLAIGEGFEDAEGGAGVARFELRRVGRSAHVVAIEAGFEIPSAPAPAAAPTATAAAEALSRPTDAAPAGGRRAVALIAPGAAAQGTAIAAPVRLEPGEYEVTAIRASGSFTRAGAERTILAEADVGRFRTVRVASGEIVDLGALTLILESRDRLLARYDPRGAEARLDAVRQAGAAGPGSRPDPILQGLLPVARPIGAGAPR
jgi:hypothetical protein